MSGPLLLQLSSFQMLGDIGFCSGLGLVCISYGVEDSKLQIRYRSTMGCVSIQPLTNAIGVSSNPAHIDFFSGRMWEGLQANCGW